MSLSTYDNKILNSLFSEREFDFLNNMTQEFQNIDVMMENERNNYRLIKEALPKNSEINASEVQNIFDVIKQSLMLLEANKQEFDGIDKDIVDLLVEVESNSDSSAQATQKIDNLKSRIMSFSNLYENLKQAVNNNDKKVEEFMIKYMSKPAEVVQPTPVNPVVTVASTITTTPVGSSKDNNVLIISEKANKVFLPYSSKEIEEYLKQYPDQYKSFNDVVAKEFVNPLNFYQRHPVLARFRETYSLIRDREAKSVFESLKMAMDLMFNYSLNPAIIAACKTQEQLETYLNCLEKNKLEDFHEFEIRFDVAPTSIRL